MARVYTARGRPAPPTPPLITHPRWFAHHVAIHTWFTRRVCAVRWLFPPPPLPQAACWARVLRSTLAADWSRGAPRQSDSPRRPPAAPPGQFAPVCAEVSVQNCAPTFYQVATQAPMLPSTQAYRPPMSPSIDRPTCWAFPSTLGITEVPTECPPTSSACGVTWWVQVSPRPFIPKHPHTSRQPVPVFRPRSGWCPHGGRTSGGEL